MLSTLPKASNDPIFSLVSAFNDDKRREKLDLGIGVYRNESGFTPVFRSVRMAEERILAEEKTKAYLGLMGNEKFNSLFQSNMLIGCSDLDNRSSSIQTPGGSGALKVLADFLYRFGPGSDSAATVWVSNPGYINHRPIFEKAGLKVREYSYQTTDERGQAILDGKGITDTARSLGPKDIMVLQAGCHNPTGTTMTGEVWDMLADLAEQRGFLPFIDNAYQGFGDGFAEDFLPALQLLDRVEYGVIAGSASKNFGLYRERTGAATVIAPAKSESLNARTHLGDTARILYSMPPDHGAAIVAEILGNEMLKSLWKDELDGMRNRLNELRIDLSDSLNRASGTGGFDFLREQKGMFSQLPLSGQEIQRLKSDFGIYILNNGRANIAGFTKRTIGYFVRAMRLIRGW